ncbi:hypothetical protein HaLaN_04845 [Haematococcus lacustris]|uniref:Uncharacterized protein n=1 Tax=Haematococcus lacustris TaxID=44745 RepID=A0A699YHV3_HAELA|nr:hypothetical protein HaLaN_04845 [Haematococcus lacustris]
MGYPVPQMRPPTSTPNQPQRRLWLPVKNILGQAEGSQGSNREAEARGSVPELKDELQHVDSLALNGRLTNCLPQTGKVACIPHSWVRKLIKGGEKLIKKLALDTGVSETKASQMLSTVTPTLSQAYKAKLEGILGEAYAKANAELQQQQQASLETTAEGGEAAWPAKAVESAPTV